MQLEKWQKYRDWYVKSDVLLLVVFFENFRKLYFENSWSHRSQYIGVPVLPGNTMLKMTSVLDFTMLLMLEKGIGGILYIAISYNWDNNLHINGSDENNKKWIFDVSRCTLLIRNIKLFANKEVWVVTWWRNKKNWYL